jgi:hypothetical protein
MIRREASRAVLTLAVFFVVLPAALAIVQPPGSAAFVVSVATVGIGIVFSTLVLLLIVLSRRQSHKKGGP